MNPLLPALILATVAWLGFAVEYCRATKTIRALEEASKPARILMYPPFAGAATMALEVERISGGFSAVDGQIVCMEGSFLGIEMIDGQFAIVGGRSKR